MLFSCEVAFDPTQPAEALLSLPQAPAVFALRGDTGEPYLNRTENLRRRVTRLLTPAPSQSKRLQLAAMVRRIAWVETGSDFEAQWLLYRANTLVHGEQASRRLHLRAPCFLRMSMRNQFPRLYATNSVTVSAASDLFGPFPSRANAERYCEQVLDLFLLRRCFQDLEPDPAFPGCIYSEMKKCLAPCFAGCTAERYSEEAAAVHTFLRTRGASLLLALAAERDGASEALDFEKAAAAHARYEKAQAVAALPPDVAGALQDQAGVLVQPSATPDHVALYLLAGGTFAGPVQFSTLGMRLPNESSGSSSLFAHPAAIAAVPLGSQESQQPATPDARLDAALAELDALRTVSLGKQELCDAQALLARWRFRPEKKREGELVLRAVNEDTVPRKPLLRAVARVFRAQVEKHAPRAAAEPMPQP